MKSLRFENFICQSFIQLQ